MLRPSRRAALCAMQRQLSESLGGREIPAREGQSPQMPVGPAQVPLTKKTPQPKSFEKPEFRLRQPSCSEMLLALLVPRHRFQRKVSGSSRSLDSRSEIGVGLTVAERTMNSPQLHQQMRLEVGIAGYPTRLQ